MHRFIFLHQLNLVVMEFGEMLDDEGLRDHLLSIYDLPEYVPGMDELNCFLRTRSVQVTGEGLRRLAQSLPRPGHENAPPNLVAVVTDTRLGVGLTRMYGVHAGFEVDQTMKVFATAGEAGDWLDVRRRRPDGTTAPLAEAFLELPARR